jgi:uncharacterized protein
VNVASTFLKYDKFGRISINRRGSGLLGQAVIVDLDWKTGGLAAGLACYRSGAFFDAHEHWEGVWLRLEEPEKSFLQALIQMTAAFHHLGKGNRAGAVSLLRRTKRRLAECPERFGGVATVTLSAQVGDWIRALDHGGAEGLDFPRIVVE